MNHSQTRKGTARNVRADVFVAQMRSADRAAFARAIEKQNVAELERAAIAGRIKEARQEAGLSQAEMAEAVDVTSRTWQNYESVSNPRTPWSLMAQIATVTGKTTEWLIHGARGNTPDLMGGPDGDQIAGIEKRLDAILDYLDALAKRFEAGGPPAPAGEVRRRLEAVEPTEGDQAPPETPPVEGSPQSSG